MPAEPLAGVDCCGFSRLCSKFSAKRDCKNQGLVELLGYDEQAGSWSRVLGRGVNQEIETVMRAIVGAMEAHTKLSILHIECHLLMDINDQLWLLYADSIQGVRRERVHPVRRDFKACSCPGDFCDGPPPTWPDR